jgi:uncharacterized Zn-binding protein involved in type VI secretion
MPHAARVTDPIAHQSRFWGTVLGAVGLAAGTAVVAVGGSLAAAGAAALSATGVGAIAAAALLVVAIASASGTIGGFGNLGRRIGTAIAGPPSIAGKIITGANHVFIGVETLPAANNAPTTKVDCHSGAHVSQGADHVHMEGWHMSRVGDGTSCGGTIVKGYPTIDVGGQPVGGKGNEVPSFWYQLVLGTEDGFNGIGGLVPGSANAKGLIMWTLGKLAENTPWAKDLLNDIGVGEALLDLAKTK